MNSKKILVVAGEVSGDAHAAELARSILVKNPAVRFYGIGGDELNSLGMELFYHVREMAFLGIGEVIRHLPFIYKVHKNLLNWARREKPVCAVLVDYPGFNLRIAKSLHKAAIPVIYYISPQLWAWGQKRVDIIRKYIDKMIVLFPFEEKFYQDYGIEVSYVGHPLVDKHYSWLPEKPRTVEPGKIKIGLLPGSRKQEVLSLLPKMIDTAKQLIRQGFIDHAEIVRVEHLSEDLYRSFLSDNPALFSIVQKPLRECLPGYDAVIVASGTATLECGYYAVPMLIVYHVNPLTYHLGKRLVKLKNIGLVNIVAEKQVAVELIQNDFSVRNAINIMRQILDADNNRQMRDDLLVIREKLGEPGASKRAADEVLEVIAHEKDS